MNRLEKAEVVDPEKVSTMDRVQFGATVMVEIESESESEDDNSGLQNGKNEPLAPLKTFVIVGVDEIKTSEGLISWKSPIGKSLLGKRVGDEIVVKIPKGDLILSILKIEYKRIDSVSITESEENI